MAGVNVLRRIRENYGEVVSIKHVKQRVHYGMHVDQETNRLWVSRGRDDDKVVVFDNELNAIQSFKCPEIECAIDLCLLPGDRVAVTDGNNPLIVSYRKHPWGDCKQLRLGKNGDFIPSGICRLGEKFLAVNLRNGSTVIIDVGLNGVLHTIPDTQTRDHYNGICCTNKDELVIGDCHENRAVQSLNPPTTLQRMDNKVPVEDDIGNKVSVYKMKWEKSKAKFSYGRSFQVKVKKPLFLTYCPMTDQIVIPSADEDRNANANHPNGRQIVMLSRKGDQWDESTVIGNLVVITENDSKEDFKPCSVAINETDPQFLYVGAYGVNYLAKYPLPLDLENLEH